MRKRPDTKTQLYLEHSALIHDRARSWSRTTGADYEELVSQGNLIFCLALRTWDKNRDRKFSSWLYLNLDRGFHDYIGSQTRKWEIPEHELERYDKNGEVYYEMEPTTPPLQEERMELLDSIQKLSKESQLVIKVVLAFPDEVMGFATLEELKKFLRAQGMKGNLVNYCVKEIRTNVLGFPTSTV